MRKMQFIAAILIGSLLTGCASTPQNFAENAGRMSDEKVCRTAFSADSDEWSAPDANMVRSELVRRNLDRPGCEALVSAQNANIAKGVVAVVGIALLARAACRDGGCGNSYSSNSDYSWDRFSNGTWRCRATHGGRFVPSSNCAGQAKVDNWP
jgi:hypothetical protein